MALLLSQAVEETKKLVKGENYGTAAAKALRSMGFSNPNVTKVRVARIVNDISANEGDTLLTAVTKELGRRGGIVSASKHTEQKQFTLSLK